MTLSATEGRQVRYVSMPGSPYTGSTLLGFLLNQHPSCVSIGAATGLTRRVDLASYRCSCGRRFSDCSFWIDISARTKDLGHPVDVFTTNFWNTHLRLSKNRYLNGLLVRSLGWDPANRWRDSIVSRASSIQKAVDEMGANTWSLATAVLEKAQKSVFVDTARDHQRPKYLATHPMLDVKVLHLVRDARGNSASIMKHTGVDVAAAARQWRHYNVEAARTKRFIAPGSWMSVRYEDLCRNPREVLNQIAEFIGVGRFPGSFSGEQEHHIIGNSMRLAALGEISEDRSWQQKLSAPELAQIARIVSRTSHELGFDWP